MKQLLFILISGLLLFSSCSNRASNEAKSLNAPSESITTLQKRVYNGDIDAYKKLKTIYLDYSPEQSLFWAMIMANKYDYAPAYLDVYYAMEGAYSRGGVKFGKKDEMTRMFLIDYLNRASKKGEKQADQILLQLQKD